MPIDSTADLLFRIGANSDDAENNIMRFRSLLSKGLGDMGAEFGVWSKNVFGDLTTVQGAMLGVSAALGAGLVAAAGAALEAAHKYSEFADEVARGSRVTGLSAENMSRLKFAAEATHVSYEALTTGLTRFSSTVVKAAEGNEQAQHSFDRLGISQEQVKAGEKDLMPLLMLVSDRFRTLGAGALATAEARDLFSRGGPALVNMLHQGSAGLKEMFEEAEKLGLVLSTKDLQASEEYKASVHMMKAELEAMAVSLGREVLPRLTTFVAMVGALPEAMKRSAQEMATVSGTLKGAFTFGLSDIGTFFEQWGAATEESVGRIESLAKRVANMGSGAGGDGLGGKVKEAKSEWSGLVEVLHKVRDATIDTTSVDERLRKEYGDLTEELDKATKKFAELKAAGSLKPEDMAAQAAAQAAMPAALSALIGRYIQEIGKKNLDAARELQEEELRQGEQTMAVKVALLDIERQKRLEKLRAEKEDGAQNLAEEERLYQQGMAKIASEAGSALSKAEQTLSAKIAALGEQTLEQKKEQFNQAVDADFAALSKDIQENKNVQNLIVALRKAGLAKIDADAKAAGDAELARLGEQRERIEREQQTSEERIAAQYQADVAKFTAAEQRKAMAAAISDAQRAQIQQMYAAIRAGLYGKEQADLNALHNSQGWQGVFGSKFAEAIRGNEALSKEWATTQQQAHMMVRVSLQSLKETGGQAFEQMAQGMGASIAQSLVYSKSLGQAMREALAQTLESISARAMVQAIYSGALGFLCLAEGDFAGAASAFEAAAIFGSVGAAAGVAGRSAAGSQGQARGGAPSVGQYGSETSARQANMQGVPAPGDANVVHVTNNFYGHVLGTSGAVEVCNMLTEAVVNSGATLTAKNTTTGKQVIL